MLQDLRYGVRMLLRERVFTLAAIAALSLGIGATTAVFSVVNTVLLRPIPYQNSERMVLIWGNLLKFGIERSQAKAAEYVDYRDQTQSFESVAAFSTADFNFTGDHQPERIAGARVTANLFPMFGAAPARGRFISPDDNVPGRDDVAVISHGFWQQRLGGETNVIGRSIRLDDRNYTVIGIVPSGFVFPHPSFNFAEPVEFWIPLAFTSEQIAQRQRPNNLNVIGLLKSSVTLDEARAEMNALGRKMEQMNIGYRGPSDSDMGWRITVVPLQEQIVGESRRALLVLLAAVALVLLIACANAANLLLMRATVRRKELAVRAALGAGRWRLIRQLLTESLVLAALSGAAGLALAWSGVKALAALGTENLPRLHEINPGILDGRVLVFTLTISLLTALIFGLAPALQASKPDLHQTLKMGEATAGRGRRRLSDLLIVGEVAMAVVLLVGAGLMINSFLRLQRIDPVVDTDRLLSVELSLPATRYPEPAQATTYYQDLIRQVESLPGVESASLSTVQALGGTAMNDPFCIEGRPLDFNNVAVAGWQLVAPGYFSTLGIPVIAGRDFTPRDDVDAPGAAIINESLARRYFPGEDPIGKRLTLGLPRPGNPWMTIVGVVRDIPHRRLESVAEPDWYIPFLQRPRRDVHIQVRASGDPASLAAAVRTRIAAIDKDQPVTAIRTLEEIISSTTAPRRFNTVLLAVFAGVALTLAALGIYSVISYSVTQRTREIGIRLALGATNGDVIRLVLQQGAAVTLIGIAIGLPGAWGATRLLKNLLYDVSSTDPATFVGVSMLLLGVSFLACWLPARRATMVDPLATLRRE